MAKQNEEEAGTLEQAAAAERFLEDPPWYARFAPDKLWAQCRLLVRMVGDYFSGDYRDVPWTTILAAVAALVYVVSPVDAIPDVLVPIGFTDDAAVVAGAIAALSHDLGLYARKKGLDPSEYGL